MNLKTLLFASVASVAFIATAVAAPFLSIHQRTIAATTENDMSTANITGFQNNGKNIPDRTATISSGSRAPISTAVAKNTDRIKNQRKLYL